jgi:hypothetical protein
MGLRLSAEKTKITRIDNGLDFLSWRIQRHRKRGANRYYVYTYPSPKAIKAVALKVKTICARGAHLVRVDQSDLRCGRPPSADSGAATDDLHSWRARCPDDRHAGFGRRLGETHRSKYRQGAPRRPHTTCWAQSQQRAVVNRRERRHLARPRL